MCPAPFADREEAEAEEEDLPTTRERWLAASLRTIRPRTAHGARAQGWRGRVRLVASDSEDEESDLEPGSVWEDFVDGLEDVVPPQPRPRLNRQAAQRLVVQGSRLMLPREFAEAEAADTAREARRDPIVPPPRRTSPMRALELAELVVAVRNRRAAAAAAAAAAASQAAMRAQADEEVCIDASDGSDTAGRRVRARAG